MRTIKISNGSNVPLNVHTLVNQSTVSECQLLNTQSGTVLSDTICQNSIIFKTNIRDRIVFFRSVVFFV